MINDNDIRIQIMLVGPFYNIGISEHLIERPKRLGACRHHLIMDNLFINTYFGHNCLKTNGAVGFCVSLEKERVLAEIDEIFLCH